MYHGRIVSCLFLLTTRFSEYALVSAAKSKKDVKLKLPHTESRWTSWPESPESSNIWATAAVWPFLLHSSSSQPLCAEKFLCVLAENSRVLKDLAALSRTQADVLHAPTHPCLGQQPQMTLQLPRC